MQLELPINSVAYIYCCHVISKHSGSIVMESQVESAWSMQNGRYPSDSNLKVKCFVSHDVTGVFLLHDYRNNVMCIFSKTTLTLSQSSYKVLKVLWI